MQPTLKCRRLLQRARDLQVPHIAAFGRVSLARFALQHAGEAQGSAGSGSVEGAGSGGGGRPPVVLAALHMTRALRDACNLQAAAALVASVPAAAAPAPGPAGAGPAAAGAAAAGGAGGLGGRAAVGALYSSSSIFGAACRGREGACAAAVAQLAGDAHLVAGGGWRQWGCGSLSALHGLAFLAGYAGDAPAGDVALAYAQLAQLAGERRGEMGGTRRGARLLTFKCLNCCVCACVCTHGCSAIHPPFICVCACRQRCC